MSLLAKYDEGTSAQRKKWVRKWLDEKPRAFAQELRESRPILRTPLGVLVSRFEDIIEVLRLPDTYTVGLYKPKMGDFMLAQDDVPAHFRDKSIMRAMLNRDDLPQIRALIAGKVKAALDTAGGRIELIENVTRMAAIALVEEYFGFRGAPKGKLFEWSYWNQRDAFHNQPFNFNDDADDIHAKAQNALNEMKGYLVTLAQKRAQEIAAGTAPQDVLTRIMKTKFADDVGFTPARFIINVGGLLIGAVETTSQAAAQVIDELLRRPKILNDARIAAREDNLSRFDGYVWEALRFQPISPYMFRLTAKTHVLGRGKGYETTLEAGDVVLPLVQSAMFDDTRFPEPNSFDPTRSLDDMFHLGWGHHECLGKYPAMAMIPEIVRQVILKDDLKIISPIDRKGTPFPEHFEISYNA
jgi:cytochrome P450